MASNDRQTRVSKYLSLYLRHQPEALGLTLGPGGWVSIDALLQAATDRGFRIARDELEAVVAGSDKQRFSISVDGSSIRANQGHSVPVDLELAPTTPPPVLYHGTGHRSVDAITSEGLRRMGRHHVHLSPDTETATRVGQRHGRPVIFVVDAAGMAADGHIFYVSENGVWLTESVPANYLTVLA
jgi:putative RNA 2'-phosphotransferase